MAIETDIPVATQVALLGQAVGNMGDDVKEMRADFKEFRQSYATKEELAYFKSEWKTAHNVLYNQLKTWKSIVVGVAIIVISAVILAYFFHIGAPTK